MLDYSNIFDENGMSYVRYRLLIDELLEQGKTTGPNNSEAMLHYSKMNVQRMVRIDKTVVLNDKLLAALADLKEQYRFLVISEGWCGDAAQILPVINKMVMAAPDKLDLRLVLRDEHPDLMNEHLTNGGRAIPVLLVLDVQQGGLIAKWGPRPTILQELLAEWRKENMDQITLAEHLHGWYAKDKTATIQEEFTRLIRGIEIHN